MHVILSGRETSHIVYTLVKGANLKEKTVVPFPFSSAAGLVAVERT